MSSSRPLLFILTLGFDCLLLVCLPNQDQTSRPHSLLRPKSQQRPGTIVCAPFTMEAPHRQGPDVTPLAPQHQPAQDLAHRRLK